MSYVERRRDRVHADLIAAISQEDPQVRADQAVRAAELALQNLHECDPRLIDSERLAGISGDMREIALTAWRVRQ